MNKDARFTDYQVLTLIKAHPGASMHDLLRFAESEMPSFVWTWGKIVKALRRLESDGKIELSDQIVMMPCKVKIATARTGGVLSG